MLCGSEDEVHYMFLVVASEFATNVIRARRSDSARSKGMSDHPLQIRGQSAVSQWRRRRVTRPPSASACICSSPSSN